MANQARAYPSFCSMNWPVHHRVTPSIKFSGIQFIMLLVGERCCECTVSCPGTQCYTYVPGESLNHAIIHEHTNHTVTTQASLLLNCVLIFKGNKYSSVQRSWVLEQSAIWVAFLNQVADLYSLESKNLSEHYTQHPTLIKQLFVLSFFFPFWCSSWTAVHTVIRFRYKTATLQKKQIWMTVITSMYAILDCK